MIPRIGALFAGYGGLEMGVQSVLGGDLAWYSEIDKGALKILTHHHPDVPNVGDITTVDWSQVEPVHILTGGSPCQDLSHAGKRAGMTEGTRSNLWVAMREAIAQLRPQLVVWENVRGAYSACADSDLGRCPRCVDSSHPGGHAPLLRALGRVLGDLSDLGYDASWHGLRAADIGAPHGRMRVFVVAHPASDPGWVGYGDGAVAALTADLGHERAGRARDGRSGSADGSLLPTPRATDGTKGGPNQRGSSGDLMLPSAVALLPTPAVNDMGAAYTPDEWDAWTDRMKAEHGNGNGHGKSLSIEAQRLLPTPTTEPMTGNGHARNLGAEARLLPTPRTQNNENRQSESLAGEDGNFYGLLHNPERWGEYAEAITRWERIAGRIAPAPTMTSTKGNPQLAPAFVEWMMGLPAGHVTDVTGITRNEALKALGNGVVPQQAEAALRFLLPLADRRAA